MLYKTPLIRRRSRFKDAVKINKLFKFIEVTDGVIKEPIMYILLLPSLLLLNLRHHHNCRNFFLHLDKHVVVEQAIAGLDLARCCTMVRNKIVPLRKLIMYWVCTMYFFWFSFVKYCVESVWIYLINGRKTC